MLLQEDPFHAFVPYPSVDVPSASAGPLAGLRVAVKDIFDVAGYRTGCGCPLKLAESDVKAATAPAIQRVFDAGARFVGKTHTDELAWSLYGVNPHFGTPVNPAAPDRIPGGSSSGSAVAVAAGLADIGIGTDTGGSVRAPASFCGIWGLRPTHGRIPLEGCMELAASLDTCGFFARDAATMEAVGGVMLGDDTIVLPEEPRLLVAVDMADRLAPEQRAAFDAPFAHLATDSAPVYPDGDADALYEAFRDIQSADCNRSVVPWMTAARIPLARGLDQRYAYARAMTAEKEVTANELRQRLRQDLDALLATDGILLAPVVHDAPFRLDAPDAVFDGYRHEAMKLLCVAGLAGLPQLVLPAGRVGDGAPFGVSLIGPRGSDRSLIAAAARLMHAHQSWT
ncbi:amidase [Nitratireductor sp. ZSWI3]|uniref:amidase n=1 Tax=Nitratireductor sp. ZSWI3 TaxID=2966359 RepID=UPI00214FEC0F|nr:amidase [Nitratireductor sp. ZSWI3]MCR4267594.1 amidase [Nitratireductor sp. ZSWI3]